MASLLFRLTLKLNLVLSHDQSSLKQAVLFPHLLWSASEPEEWMLFQLRTFHFLLHINIAFFFFFLNESHWTAHIRKAVRCSLVLWFDGGVCTFFSWVERPASRSFSAEVLASMTRACLSSACNSSMWISMAASLVADSCRSLSTRLSPSAAARLWPLTESVRACKHIHIHQSNTHLHRSQDSELH